MTKEKILVELLDGGKMPVKALESDAAYDVFTREDFELEDWGRFAIPLGFRIQLPKHLCALVQPRGGLSKEGLPVKVEYYNKSVKDERVDADVKLGLVDSGFTGEVTAIVKTYDVRSLGVKRVFVPKGTKVAQMRLAEVPDTELTLGTIEKDTERGEGRFNHTGW